MIYEKMTAADVDRIARLYMDYYNRHEDGCWTHEKACRRIRQIVTVEDSLCLIQREAHHVTGFAIGYFKEYDDLLAYYLEEIAAPAGYGSLLEPVEVTIDAQGNVTYPGGTGTVRVLNIPGASLPSTGGMGTALFYTVGGLLIAAAAGLLFVLRRRAK